jgi:hypothetical protein
LFNSSYFKVIGIPLLLLLLLLFMRLLSQHVHQQAAAAAAALRPSLLCYFTQLVSVNVCYVSGQPISHRWQLLLLPMPEDQKGKDWDTQT